MQATWPFVKDLVLVGGGHAHALVLRMWAMDPLPGTRVTLVSPDPVAPYTGMLPGLTAGLYRREEVMVDLVRLCAFAQVRLILGRATGIDPAARVLHVEGQAPLPYDVLSVDVGGQAVMPGVPGLAQHVVPARPLGTFAARWEAFVDSAGDAPAVAVLGAGAGGAELALAAHHRLARSGRRPTVALIDREERPKSGLSPAARRRMLAALHAAGVCLHLGAGATQVTPGAVHLPDTTVPADLTIVAAGVQAPPWFAGTGLDLHDGWLRVGATLQTSDPAVFAAGDCAHLSHAPRPKAGVFAVRAAPVLLHNLKAALSGRPMRDFRPQRDFLRLLSTGDGRAVADWRGLSASGAWVWRWKDRIDRRFMARFDSLPAMLRPPAPPQMAEGLADLLAERPLCGGCGSKVGALTLAEGLKALPAPDRPDIVAGAGDDAAVLRAGDALQVITTDHLRAVTQDEGLMATIAAHHAMGDVLAMGAAPQVALAQITLPAAAPAIQARMLARIQQAAAAAFAQAGAQVVGGHTTAGPELVLGFTVTGTTTPATLRRQAGAQPGDAILLTRALGTGTILASLMAGARLPGALLGEVVATALAQMARPPAPAAALLAPHASAMTDVTGFGLAGHLLEICDASGTGAEIDLAAVPLLPGAQELAAAGERSSLAPANRAATLGRVSAPDTPAAALLWDPQTCGGFLAAVPPQHVEKVLADLRLLGEAVAQIGRVTGSGKPATILVR